MILAYASGSGKTILQQAIEGGEFDATAYIGGDGMVGDDLLTGLPADAVNGKIIATRAGAYTGESADYLHQAGDRCRPGPGRYLRSAGL